MKYILMAIALVFIVGCGSGGDSSAPSVSSMEECVGSELTDIPVGYVRDYNISNQSNRVNIFISMGQSNSAGVYNDNQTIINGVLMPVESIRSYPDILSFVDINSSMVNKAENTPVNLTNTATKFAEKYNSDTPLYIVNIARGSQSISLEKCRYQDNFAMNRKDIDNLSMYPQTIHYLQTLFKQLQDQGKEPYVIAFDWNQWESEPYGLSAYEYYDRYYRFFEGISSVIPNKDFKMFICNPTSNAFEHKDILRDAFSIFKDNRLNTEIYYPDSINQGDIWVDAPKIHYNIETYEKIAEYIYNNL